MGQRNDCTNQPHTQRVRTLAVNTAGSSIYTRKQRRTHAPNLAKERRKAAYPSSAHSNSSLQMPAAENKHATEIDNAGWLLLRADSPSDEYLSAHHLTRCALTARSFVTSLIHFIYTYDIWKSTIVTTRDVAVPIPTQWG